MDLDAPADHAAWLHRLVFLDQTGTTTKHGARPPGRSLRGQRLLSKVPFGHWKTQTFIAGLRCDAYCPLRHGRADGPAHF